MEQRISIERMEQAVNLFGSFDENVRLIESEFKVTVSNREGELRVNGEVEDTMLACKALQALLTISNRGEPITEQNVRYVISLVRAGQEERISELTQDVICISSKGRPIKPKTIGQKRYIESVLKNTIEHIEERIVERAQVRVDLALQVARQKAEALARLDRGAR